MVSLSWKLARKHKLCSMDLAGYLEIRFRDSMLTCQGKFMNCATDLDQEMKLLCTTLAMLILNQLDFLLARNAKTCDVTCTIICDRSTELSGNIRSIMFQNQPTN